MWYNIFYIYVEYQLQGQVCKNGHWKKSVSRSNEISSTEWLALVHTFLIDSEVVHWQAELLDTAALAPLELPPLLLAVILSFRSFGGRTARLDGVLEAEVDFGAFLGSPGLLADSAGVGDCRHRHELQVRVHHHSRLGKVNLSLGMGRRWWLK